MSPNDPRLLTAGLVVVALFVGLIAYARLTPTPTPRLGLFEVDPEGETIHVPSHAPCTLDRVQRACDRWAAHGWPRCVAQPTGGTTRLIVYDGPEAGAAGEAIVGVAPGRCGAGDPSLEHELGHALYDLAHVARAGAVMCHDTSCAGLTFPEAP